MRSYSHGYKLSPQTDEIIHYGSGFVQGHIVMLSRPEVQKASSYLWPQSFCLYILDTVSYLTAEVAKTRPLEPTDSTIIEATTTIRSALIENEGS